MRGRFGGVLRWIYSCGLFLYYLAGALTIGEFQIWRRNRRDQKRR